MSETLGALRERLGAIDAEILTLIQERQEKALAIGAIKRDMGRGTRDFAQESEVIGRACDKARSLGLDETVARELMNLLLRSSLTAQEQDRVAAHLDGEGQTALVIGGAGKMGRWFARFLRSQGYSVTIVDPRGSIPGMTHGNDLSEVTVTHDLVVVATPLGATNEVLRQLARRKTEGVVFDLSSVKTPLRSGLKELVEAGVNVTSLHPMFGPDTDLLSGRHVVFVDVGCKQATERAKELFLPTMATLVDMDLENHDRLMAYVLGLSHAVNLAFLTALTESGEAAPKLAELSSTTFDAQFAVASKVAAENPHLYYEIQQQNDYGTESLSALLYAVERIRSVIRADDEDAFVTIMERANRYVTTRPPKR